MRSARFEGLPRRSRRVRIPGTSERSLPRRSWCARILRTGEGGKIEQHEVSVVSEPEAIETECRHRRVPFARRELVGHIEQPHLHRRPSDIGTGAQRQRSAVGGFERIPVVVAGSPAGQPVQPPDTRDVAARGADWRRVRQDAQDPHLAAQHRIEADEQAALAGLPGVRHDRERARNAVHPPRRPQVMHGSDDVRTRRRPAARETTRVPLARSWTAAQPLWRRSGEKERRDQYQTGHRSDRRRHVVRRQ